MSSVQGLKVLYKKLTCLFSCGLVLGVYVEPAELSFCSIGLSFRILVSEIETQIYIYIFFIFLFFHPGRFSLL